MSATVNGHRALSVRVLTPWSGVWIADVDLDPEDVSAAPTSGAATVKIGDSVTLVGTVDPRGSGSFVSSTKLRVVGGGAGWDRLVTPQHWHSDGGVVSTDVYRATATQVGETVNDRAPSSLGTDFVRSAGPAARVFVDTTWWVDFAGVTQVGARPSAKADASLELLEWDPAQQRAELACDALVVPGTLLTDPRLVGLSPVVRDVEQTFDHEGSRASAWCAMAPASRLGGAFKHMIREFGGLDYLKIYRYRFVQEQGSTTKIALQAVHKSAGFPDTIPVSVWSGVSGMTAKLKGSTEVLVEFIDGDPTQPIVRGFSTLDLPLEATVDASDVVHLGPTSNALELVGGGHPIAFADKLLLELGKIATAMGTGSCAGPSGPLPVVFATAYVAPAAANLIGSEKAKTG